MMEEALDWRGGSLPPGALVAIKDCVAAKGGFLLTFFLKKLLASTNPGDANNVIAHRQPTAMTRVLFVAIAEPFSHYHRISKKQVLAPNSYIQLSSPSKELETSSCIQFWILNDPVDSIVYFVLALQDDNGVIKYAMPNFYERVV
jgi:hypothetical protein